METLLKNPKWTCAFQQEVLRFFEHLNKSKATRDDAIRGLSAEIVKTWTKADCPPMTIKYVKAKLRLLLAEDKAAKSKNISHKAKKAKTGVPTRKSLRQNPEGNGQSNEAHLRMYQCHHHAQGPVQAQRKHLIHCLIF